MSQVTTCARCGRRLTDPVSVARSMGPLCWGLSNGGLYEKDLEASEQEWARREKVLRDRGEIDLGCNWQYIAHDPSMALQLPHTMRVSVRLRAGQFEAYGCVFGLGAPDQEIVFLRSADLKAAYTAAVQAGPASTATAHRIQKTNARRARSGRRAA